MEWRGARPISSLGALDGGSDRDKLSSVCRLSVVCLLSVCRLSSVCPPPRPTRDDDRHTDRRQTDDRQTDRQTGQKTAQLKVRVGGRLAKTRHGPAPRDPTSQPKTNHQEPKSTRERRGRPKTRQTHQRTPRTETTKRARPKRPPTRRRIRYT